MLAQVVRMYASMLKLRGYAVLVFACSGGLLARTWTDTQGRTIKAELVATTSTDTISLSKI